ncbi:MAG TPA: nuclear transport factor 2 family protein [Mucilaginibacter sp.]|jgi:hypothetical protein
MKKIIVFLIGVSLGYSASAQNNAGNPAAFWHDPVRNRKDPESLKTVKDFLSAYQTGKKEVFASYLTDGIVWDEPGENRISGKKTSKHEVLQMLDAMTESSAGSVKVSDIRYFDDGGNTVVCLLHWTAVQPVGRILDVLNAGVFTVENGKITAVKLYSDNIEAENIFWGQD